MFELGRIDFSNSDDFFRENDFHMTKEIRSFISIVCDAHRCCSSGVNEEYMRGIDLGGYADYMVGHNAAVARAVKETGKIPEDSYFESAWELQTHTLSLRGNCITCTTRPKATHTCQSTSSLRLSRTEGTKHTSCS